MAGQDSQGIKIGFGATPTYVANVSAIKGLNATAETIDVTALDSTGGYREFITSFKDAGEVEVTINVDPANEATHRDVTGGVNKIFDDNTEESWTILFPDGTTKAVFNAYVSESLGVDAGVGNQLTGTLKLRVTGKPTWTYPA